MSTCWNIRILKWHSQNIEIQLNFEVLCRKTNRKNVGLHSKHTMCKGKSCRNVLQKSEDSMKKKILRFPLFDSGQLKKFRYPVYLHNLQFQMYHCVVVSQKTRHRNFAWSYTVFIKSINRLSEQVEVPRESLIKSQSDGYFICLK